MTISKSPMIRYQILDNCFRHPIKKYFIEDLILECNNRLAEIHGGGASVSRRQIFHDIMFMESTEGWSVDLLRKKEGKRVYYKYANPKYSINNSPLNSIEMVQFKSALKVLSGFSGLPQFSWLHKIFEKINPSNNSESNDDFVRFDANEYLIGIDNFGEIFNAISLGLVLHIVYKPFNSQENQILTIHPYYLKEYNNRWFLFGRNKSNGRNDWNLALDRIRSITIDEKEQYEPNVTAWSEYFEDIIGVTKPLEGNVETVELLFNGMTCYYVLTKPMHGSQRSQWIDKDSLKLKVMLELIINTELERLILSYGKSVKVLTPQSLQTQIVNQLEQASEQYL